MLERSEDKDKLVSHALCHAGKEKTKKRWYRESKKMEVPAISTTGKQLSLPASLGVRGGRQ
jgi:hypothetical protein